jgi:uncharacterized protein (TIGR03435 family)
MQKGLRNEQIILHHSGRSRKLALACIGIIAIFVTGIPARQVIAQSGTTDWQTAAGGKMAFDVASVKRNKQSSDLPFSTNIPLGPGDYFTPTGGFFTATNIYLFNYILFAYKVTGNQLRILQEEVPAWVRSDRFDIQARAEGNPTKDQMRRMMQSLLADRFELSVHTETRQLPVFALTQLRDGKFGPQLQPHSESIPCSTLPDAPASGAASQATIAGGLPKTCGGIGGLTPSVPGRSRIGARNVTMEFIAMNMASIGRLDRAVVNETGLSGTFDFILEWMPERRVSATPNDAPQPEDLGPTFLEALQEQLGLKLVSRRGPVEALVIDIYTHLSR